VVLIALNVSPSVYYFIYSYIEMYHIACTGNVSTVHSMKACKGNGGKFPPILKLSTSGQV